VRTKKYNVALPMNYFKNLYGGKVSYCHLMPVNVSYSQLILQLTAVRSNCVEAAKFQQIFSQ